MEVTGLRNNRMPCSTEYTDLQRKAINLLSYLSVSLTTVEIEEDGNYALKSGGLVKTFLYVLVTLNTFIKFAYLVLLVFGNFGPVEFLDRMSALLWILMCLEITQELLFYAWKYPLYEVLINLWSLENRIFFKLGKPQNVKERCDRKNRKTLLFHLGILLTGCFLIAVQFLSAPKYSVYTYSAFEEDNWVLLYLFTWHETCFMWHAWTGYLSVVSISALNAVELSCTLNAMTNALESVTCVDEKINLGDHNGENLTTRTNVHFEGRNSIMKIIDVDEELGKVHPLNNVDNIAINIDIDNTDTMNHRMDLSSSVMQNQFTLKAKVVMMNTVMNPNKLAPGTFYTVPNLIEDYRQLTLVSDLLNHWTSYRIVGVHTIGYCQFISDVFMMIQLIMLPEMDVPAVLWFGEDALVCLFMLFRLFTLMSEVAPSSEHFLRGIQCYLTYQNPLRRRFLKTLKTLRLVSLKLGPCPVQPGTVGAAVMMLMNYYIVVALWK